MRCKPIEFRWDTAQFIVTFIGIVLAAASAFITAYALIRHNAYLVAPQRNSIRLRRNTIRNEPLP